MDVGYYEGFWWWYCDHNLGLWSREYKRLCQIQLRPSPLSRGPEDELAQSVYDALCDRTGCDHARKGGRHGI